MSLESDLQIIRGLFQIKNLSYSETLHLKESLEVVQDALLMQEIPEHLLDQLAYIFQSREPTNDIALEDKILSIIFMIKKTMQPTFLKIRCKERTTIVPGSSPEIPTSMELSIPSGTIGQFFLRKKLAKQGLVSSANIFHPSWVGTPSIILNHQGANMVELMPGEELGELWLIKLGINYAR